jgi:cytochrome c5
MTTKNNEFSISIMLVAGLLVAVGLIYLFVFSMAKDGFGKNMDRVNQELDGSLLERIRPVMTLADITGNAMPVETSAVVAMKSPKELYDGACMACHSTGVAGAPKLGDAAAWEPRFSVGLDGLTSSAIAGKGAMPPNGGSSYNADEIETTIIYILSETGLMDAPVAAAAANMPAMATPEPEAAASTGNDDLAAGEKHYRIACFACHDSGAAGAPRLGDQVAWSARVDAGLDAMVLSAINGKGAMPPKGGAMQLSDDDIRNAVAFMVNKVN